MVELPDFAFFLVRSDLVVILLHKFTLGRLLGKQSLDKVNLLVKHLQFSSPRVVFGILDNLHKPHKFLVDILPHDVDHRGRDVIVFMGFLDH